MVADKLLQLFERYDIHATWATVGLLAHPTVEELKAENANRKIPYQNTTYSPFPLKSQKYGDFPEDLLIGLKEIKSIIDTPNQEFASHTYSHFYCKEEGTSFEDFEDDAKKMQAISESLKVKLESIVFPRNQVDETCLGICAQQNIKAFRGNQENRFWRNSQFEKESVFKKAGRVIDAYFNISKTKAYSVDKLPEKEGLLNVPANRFFRAYSDRFWLEKRKIRRIKKEMFRAAKNDTVYHLWWHPHNFALNTTENLKQIEELLAYSNVLKDKFDFQSLNMSEISAHARN